MAVRLRQDNMINTTDVHIHLLQVHSIIRLLVGSVPTSSFKLKEGLASKAVFEVLEQAEQRLAESQRRLEATLGAVVTD